jgi:hypothetical protein
MTILFNFHLKLHVNIHIFNKIGIVKSINFAYGQTLFLKHSDAYPCKFKFTHSLVLWKIFLRGTHYMPGKCS